ncbi:hypothetical protein GCM10027578_42880 [Spirosoma luteolum]
MAGWITTLRTRNTVLYTFGLLSLLAGLGFIGVALVRPQPLLGVNAFYKPVKFFISTTVFCWSMGWFTGLLPQRRSVRIYSWVVVSTLAFELIVIAGQATLGKISHFNISTPVDGALFSLMGIAITVLTGWTLYIDYLFFRTSPTDGATGYWWGIRLGILLFVVFAFEGFLMATRLSHTVGAPDGGPGLPLLNWSTAHGDLRVAHFFGMHALQLLPLLGNYVARRPAQLVGLAVAYLLLVSWLLVQALGGLPAVRV